MWRRSVRVVVALGLLLALIGQYGTLPLAGHVERAQATGTLSLTPTTGVAGSTVSISAPNGTFNDGESVSLQFKDAGNPPATFTYPSLTANSNGGLSSVNEIVPTNAAAGAGTFTATGAISDNPAVGTFTVYKVQPGTPTVSPSTGPVGQNVLVHDTGFTPNGTVSVTMAGVQASIVYGGTADPSGNVNALVTVPQISVGYATVVVTDNSSGLTGSSTNGFYVNSSSVVPTATNTQTGNNGVLAVNPTSGPPSVSGGTATTVTISAYNLPQNAYISSLNFTDSSGHVQSVTPSNSYTTGSGTYNTTVTLPTQATYGNATFQLCVSGSGYCPAATFVVNPVLRLSGTTSVSPGQTVTVTGAGFKPNTQFILSLGTGSALTTSPSPPVSDAYGNLNVTVTIPSTTPAGTYFITAQDTGGQEYTTTSPNQVTVSSSLTTSTNTATPTPTWTPYGYVPTATATPTPTWTPYGYAPTATWTATATATSAQSTVTTDYFAEGYTGLASTNGKASFTEVLNILNPGSTTATVTITYYVQGASTPQVVVRQVAATTLLRESVNNDVGADKAVAAVVTSPQALVVTREISRVTPTSTRLDGSTTQPAGAPATFLAFPEGYTGISYQEYLTILNPNSTAAAVQLVLAPQASSAAGARSLTLSVPPLSRTTTSIRALNTGNNQRSVGMLLTSNVPIVAERVEYFGDGAGSGKFGSTVSQGFTTPSTNLRIPYATSGGTAPDPQGHQQATGAQAFVTLLNPATGGSPVQVTVGFTNSQGQGISQPVQVTVAPGTRQTVVVNTALGSAAVGPFSISVSSTGPVFAESAQYYGGSPNIGTHPGIVLPAFTGATTDAFLSDLATELPDGAAVQRTAYLYNPSSNTASVTVTYYGQTGATAQATYTVPAGGITSVNVNTDVQSTIPPGAVGAEFKLTSGSTGTFIVAAVGITTDNLSATEDFGSPLP